MNICQWMISNSSIIKKLFHYNNVAGVFRCEYSHVRGSLVLCTRTESGLLRVRFSAQVSDRFLRAEIEAERPHFHRIGALFVSRAFCPLRVGGPMKSDARVNRTHMRRGSGFGNAIVHFAALDFSNRALFLTFGAFVFAQAEATAEAHAEGSRRAAPRTAMGLPGVAEQLQTQIHRDAAPAARASRHRRWILRVSTLTNYFFKKCRIFTATRLQKGDIECFSYISIKLKLAGLNFSVFFFFNLNSNFRC